MRTLRLLVPGLAGLLLLAGAAGANPGVEAAVEPSPRVGIFYYPWFSTPRSDGRYAHWQQNGNAPPARVASSFYPARGVYSSADAVVVDAQLAEIARAGIGTVIASWWGRGSVEDVRLPQLVAAARAYGLTVAAHLEPYEGRTVASTGADIAYLRTFGLSDFYVWASVGLPDGEWKALNDVLTDVRVFANTNLAGRAAAGGVLLGPGGAVLMALAALISVYGYLAGAMVNVPRLSYAMAVERDLPPLLGRVHPRFHTPHLSVLVFATLVWLLAASGSFLQNLTLSAVSRLFTYGVVCAALIACRRREERPEAQPVPPASFRLPAGKVWAVLGIAGTALLATRMAQQELLVLAATALLATLNWTWATRRAR